MRSISGLHARLQSLMAKTRRFPALSKTRFEVTSRIRGAGNASSGNDASGSDQGGSGPLLFQAARRTSRQRRIFDTIKQHDGYACMHPYPPPWVRAGAPLARNTRQSSSPQRYAGRPRLKSSSSVATPTPAPRHVPINAPGIAPPRRKVTPQRHRRPPRAWCPWPHGRRYSIHRPIPLLGFA